MRFADIPGLDDVKKVLTQAVHNNHIAHAQLFLGTEGALNLPLALAYATFLHCQNRTTHDACGECAACSKSLKYIHPDTHFVFPIGNIKGTKDEEVFKIEKLKIWRAFISQHPFGNLDDWAVFHGGEDKQVNISREESREIIKILSLKSFESAHKIMIIWQPEYMHPSAANGILKILEEPTPNTYFILVTNAAERLLSTILSRTQLVTIPLLTHEALQQTLVSKHKVEPPHAQKISRWANGDLHLALNLLAQQENDNTNQFIEWMRMCFKRDYSMLVTMAETYHSLDKLHQRSMLIYSTTMLRETLLHIAGAQQINRVQNEELKFVQDFSRVMNWQKIEESIRLINDAIYHVERNGSAKMIFLDLSLHLSEISNT